MNEQTLKAKAAEEGELDITVIHAIDLKYTMKIDGETLKTRRGPARLFRLKGASEFLLSLGITEFRVKN